MRSLIWVAIFAIPSILFAAAAGTVRGTVVGPDNRPMSGVVVTLRNDVTGFKQQSATGTDGGFSFFNVPYNPYTLRVDVQGFASVARDVDVRSPVAVEVPVKLAVAQLTESISVTASAPVAPWNCKDISRTRSTTLRATTSSKAGAATIRRYWWPTRPINTFGFRAT